MHTGESTDATVRTVEPLAEELAKLSNAVHHTADSVIICDRNGLIEYVNPAFEALSGFALYEVIGKTPRILKSGAHPPPFYENLWAVLLAAKVYRGVLVNRRKTGELYYEEQTISPIIGEDAVITHYVSVGRDVSARIKAQAAQKEMEAQLLQSQKMEAIGRLAGGVAHDVNNLLAIILGHVGMIYQDTVEPAVIERLQEVQSAAGKAVDLTGQLLAFGRPRDSTARAVDLNQVIREIARMLCRAMPSQVRIEVLPSVGLWSVMAGSGQLEQVVMNLALNARDAMPEGGTLRLGTSNAGSPDRRVLLEVSDTGAGIDSLIIPRIFEPYFTTKELGRGTGLGLSTVYGIVRQLGGQIEVTSAPGQGTRFLVSLPAADHS